MCSRLFLVICILIAGKLTAAAPVFSADSASAVEQETYEKSSEKNGPYFKKENWEKARHGIRYEEEKRVENPVEAPTKGSNLPNLNFSFLKILLYVIPIGILSVIVFYIAKSIGPVSFHPKIKPSIHPSEIISEENFLLLDLEENLRTAVANENFALATHLLHLILLQKLVASGHLVWRKDQTNRTLLAQIIDEEIRQEVRALFKTYELVWYGQKEWSQSSYLGHASACQMLFTNLQLPA